MSNIRSQEDLWIMFVKLTMRNTNTEHGFKGVVDTDMIERVAQSADELLDEFNNRYRT